MPIVALAGGVGGARLADGLLRAVQEDPVGEATTLTVVVNTGDDFEHLGLWICPDLDTVCYTLARMSNPETGWGQANETWQALESVKRLGGPDWFRLGDRDLGVHLERTRRLRLGEPLSAVTLHFCQVWGIPAQVLPATDDQVPTWVNTDEGELPFQEYFVKRQCSPRVKGFRFAGVEQAQPTAGVLAAIEAAGLVVICPSNPWVSIDPILSLPGVRQALSQRTEAGLPVIAVSPIIGGKTVKGPAAKMYAELGIAPSALAVARHYGGQFAANPFGFVLDEVDIAQAEAVRELGMVPFVTNTWMKTPQDRLRLAKEVLAYGRQLSG